MPNTVTDEVCKILGGKDSLQNLESPSLKLEKILVLESGNKRKQVDDFVIVASQHQYPNQAFRFSLLPQVKTIYMKLQSPMIINQSGGILENAGMSLHRNLGFPLIPGSAVKGIARHYAWLQWYKAMENKEAEAKTLGLKMALTFGFPTGDHCSDNKEDPSLDGFLGLHFPEIFGKNGKICDWAGAVIFFPAQPREKVALFTDVVTTHHPKYYGGEKKVATDDESPVPNFFPAVKADTENDGIYEFSATPVQRDIDWALSLAGQSDFKPIDFAMDCMSNGMSFLGAGAKTNSGYGWFKEISKEKQQAYNNYYMKKRKLSDLISGDTRDLYKELKVMKGSELAQYLEDFPEKSLDEKRLFFSSIEQLQSGVKDKIRINLNKGKGGLYNRIADAAKEAGVTLDQLSAMLDKKGVKEKSIKKYTFKVLSPCFCAGADQKEPEIRASSIRGELRWWFRILGGSPEQETVVFGGVNKKHTVASSLQIRVKTKERILKGRLTKNLKGFTRGSKGQADRRALYPETKFELYIRGLSDIKDESSRFLASNAIDCFRRMGGFGLRATRGAGAVGDTENLLTKEEYQIWVESLSNVSVKLLKMEPDVLKQLERWLKEYREDNNIKKNSKDNEFGYYIDKKGRRRSNVILRPVLLSEGVHGAIIRVTR